MVRGLSHWIGIWMTENKLMMDWVDLWPKDTVSPVRGAHSFIPLCFVVVISSLILQNETVVILTKFSSPPLLKVVILVKSLQLIWRSGTTLVQVMTWCRQATSHYLNQCWPDLQISCSGLQEWQLLVQPMMKISSKWQYLNFHVGVFTIYLWDKFNHLYIIFKVASLALGQLYA